MRIFLSKTWRHLQLHPDAKLKITFYVTKLSLTHGIPSKMLESAKLSWQKYEVYLQESKSKILAGLMKGLNL